MLHSDRVAAAVALIGVLVVAPPAVAQDEPEGATAEEEGHFVSITISPLHLIFPIAEFTAEFRVHDRVGLAGVLGAGTLGPHITDLSNFVLEVGASVRGYLVGDFDHGMQLGAEVLYALVTAQEGSTTGLGNGLGLSPFLGYKYSSSNGFTFDMQAGPSFGLVAATASNSDGTTASESSGLTIGFMLNINLGYSF